MQHIANAKTYAGMTVTFSVAYQNLSGKFGIGIHDGASLSQTAFTTAKSGKITLTKTIQSACTNLSCKLLKELTTNVSVEILYAKLEIGSFPSTFIQKTYDEDFALCKPYFLRLNGFSNYSIFASGMTYSTSKSFFLIPHKMRTAPSATSYGKINILISSGYKEITSLYQTAYCDGGTTLCCTGSNFTAGEPAILSSVQDPSAYIDLDAEIY